MERSGLFNSENGDRKYNAKVFAKMISLMISNGVYFSPANNLQVVEIKDSMKVKVNDGIAFINGYIYENKNELNDELTFTLPSSPNGDLIYRIILRLDADENRLIRAYVINGEISKTPVAPPLVRNDKYYDICLAEILIKQGQTFIKPSDIKDTRLSNELCGITRIPLEHLKTEEVFRQFNEWFAEQKVILGTDLTTWEDEYKKKYEEFKKAQEQAFNDWFTGIKAMLGDNPNTALINEMDKLRKDMSSMMEIYKTEIYASMEKLKEDIKNDPELNSSAKPMTYAQLKILKDTNKLIVGKTYILTDYRTIYKQPDTNVIKTMDIEELVLTASGVNTFEPIVFSSKYPQDTIWYEFNNDKCEDNSTPRNGFITRRYDHVSGNNVPQDWRTMLWARWRPDATQYYKNDTLTNYSVWTSGSAVMGVIYKAGNLLLVAKNTSTPSKADDSSVFDIVYNDTTVGMLRTDKTKVLSQTSDKLELKKGELHERLTFGDNCIRNTIGECTTLLHSNVFGNSCQSNSFGNGCFNNSFGNSCQNNSFGNGCYNNSFGNGCYSNVFGNSCLSNSFGNDCYNNSFGSVCQSNSFGNSCQNNSFGNRCYNNSFGNNCQNLFVKLLQSKNLNSLDIYYKPYTINIEKNNNNLPVFWHLDSSNQPVYTLIP